MIDGKRIVGALLLAGVGAALSGLLLLEYHGEAVGAVSRMCGEGSASGCTEVARSPWAAPAGVPLAAVGLAFYWTLGLLFALAWAAPTPVLEAAAKLGVWAVGVALGFDVLLLGLQAFDIGAFCSLCIATYVVNAALLALLWPGRRADLNVPGAGGGRLLVTGWLSASLAATAAVAATDWALAERQTQRERNVLNTAPAAETVSGQGESGTADRRVSPVEGESAAPGARASAASVEHENRAAGGNDGMGAVAGHKSDALAKARERIRTLQETLDDPQKLQKYLNNKAVERFDGTPAQQVALGSAPRKGAEGAPIGVVEYSDLMCPHCRNVARGLDEFVPSSGGRVALFFKNYPLDTACNKGLPRNVHPGACQLALGGICAHEQGRFWPYHDAVFAETALRKPGRTDVVRLAGKAGLDIKKLEPCLDAPATHQQLTSQIEEGNRVGVTGTPTLLINGKKLEDLGLFVQLVNREAARLGLAPIAAPGR